MPIVIMAGMIATLKKAKVTPTASASMLVATARVNIVATAKLFFSFWAQSQSSSFSKDSLSMLPPIIASNTNATQWS